MKKNPHTGDDLGLILIGGKKKAKILNIIQQNCFPLIAAKFDLNVIDTIEIFGYPGDFNRRYELYSSHYPPYDVHSFEENETYFLSQEKIYVNIFSKNDPKSQPIDVLYPSKDGVEITKIYEIMDNEKNKKYIMGKLKIEK